jgi:hypothetical protein
MPPATTDPYFLSTGSHPSPQEGRCANEWMAYLAGEPHSDSPRCVSPVLRSFTMSLNDRLADETRQKLRPYLARCLGTADDGRDEERVQILLEWLVRTATPKFMDLAGCEDTATRLRELPGPLTVENTRRILRDVREEANKARSRALARLRAKFPAAAAAYADAAYAAAAYADAAYAAAAYAAAAYADAAYAAAAYAYAAAAYAAYAAAYDAAAYDAAARAPARASALRSCAKRVRRVVPCRVVAAALEVQS